MTKVYRRYVFDEGEPDVGFPPYIVGEVIAMVLTCDEEADARGSYDAATIRHFEPADLNHDRSVTLEELVARPDGRQVLRDWQTGASDDRALACEDWRSRLMFAEEAAADEWKNALVDEEKQRHGLDGTPLDEMKSEQWRAFSEAQDRIRAEVRKQFVSASLGT